MELKGGTRENGNAILVTSLPLANSQKFIVRVYAKRKLGNQAEGLRRNQLSITVPYFAI